MTCFLPARDTASTFAPQPHPSPQQPQSPLGGRFQQLAGPFQALLEAHGLVGDADNPRYAVLVQLLVAWAQAAGQ